MKKKQRQFSLDLGPDHKRRISHGGTLRQGKRKLARPLATKRSLHVVLRSQKAVGSLSLLTHSKQVRKILNINAQKFQVKIERFANMGNHLHLVIRGNTKREIQNFFRTITALIARLVTGAKKGKAFGTFWDHLIFTRVLSWGKDRGQALQYVTQNIEELWGIADYKPRTIPWKTWMGFG